MSLSFSARWVCRCTPWRRASAAASRIRPVPTENGEHGATTSRVIANRPGSCQRAIRRSVSARMSSSRSTTSSGGSPPWLAPTLIEPRAAWKRSPAAAAASMLSSSRVPAGYR